MFFPNDASVIFVLGGLEQQLPRFRKRRVTRDSSADGSIAISPYISPMVKIDQFSAVAKWHHFG